MIEQFFKYIPVSDNKEDTIIGNAAFFAPGILIEPVNLDFPIIFNLSIGFS